MGEAKARYYERWANMESAFHTLRAACLLLIIALLCSLIMNLVLATRRQVVVGLEPGGRRKTLPVMQSENSEALFVQNTLATLYNWDQTSYEDAYRSASKFMTAALGARLVETLDSMTRAGIDGESLACSLAIDRARRLGPDTWEVTGIKTLSGRTVNIRRRVVFAVQVERGPVTDSNPWGLRVAAMSEREVLD